MPSAETRPFWDGARAGALRLPRCPRCAILLYPPPPRCPGCHSDRLEWKTSPGTGRLASWTVVHLRTIPGVEPPFVMAEVELDDQPGLIVTALLVEAAESKLCSGMAVRACFTDPGPDGTRFPEFRTNAERP